MDDVAALVVRIGIRLGMNRVVVILGIGRIDRDQRHVAPVLAPLQLRRLCRLSLAQGRGRKSLRNFVGMDRDQADSFFARERAEPFLHFRRGQPVTARAHEIDADEVAILGPRLSALAMFSSRPACFLSIGTSRPPPSGSLRKIPSSRALAWSITLM